ncbi:MAG: hypothetical protein IJ324_13255 [Lachnospiraceae bacterium]|nr:hypothetical protein [Lachnospiraceae bacterium]
MKKYRLAIGILAAFLLTGCGMEEYFAPAVMETPEDEKILTIELLESEISEEVSGEEETENGTLPEPTAESTGEFDDPAQWTYAYDQLDEASKSWYRVINASLLAMGDSPVTLTEEGLAGGLTEEDIDRIFQCVLLDHPEYFFVTGYQYTKYTRGDELVSIDFIGTYSMDKEAALVRKEEIEESVAGILAGIAPDVSDYEKVRYVYETIIKNTEYNMDAPDNQNIYSVLKGGASVCQGYAKTTQLLLNRLGVECTLVQGDIKEGGGHAWNMVLVDGEYYYMDTTWGDASYQMENMESSNVRIPDISYDYLCVTSADLFRTHTLDCVVSMPECTAVNANYYVKEGCFFSSFDEAQVNSLIQKVTAEGREEIYFKCADESVYATFKEKLIDGGSIFDYLGDTHSAVAYTQNDQAFLLTFWMTKG